MINQYYWEKFVENCRLLRGQARATLRWGRNQGYEAALPSPPLTREVLETAQRDLAAIGRATIWVGDPAADQTQLIEWRRELRAFMQEVELDRFELPSGFMVCAMLTVRDGHPEPWWDWKGMQAAPSWRQKEGTGACRGSIST